MLTTLLPSVTVPEVPGRLNAVELETMDSPLRRLSQRLVELPTFGRLLDRAGIALRGKRLLEIGCGNGYGLSLLERRFAPSRLVGVDPMPEQLARAWRAPRRADLLLGDVTRLELEDAGFDAVFVFGVLHHVPAWRLALAELHRVLAPGGVLLVEEIVGGGVDFSDRWLGTEHPETVRLDWPGFRRAIDASGFERLGERLMVPGFARSFLARRTGG